MDQLSQPGTDFGTLINLSRPLVFFDLETTGVETHVARIVELSAIKLNPDKTQERLYYVLNPGVHIPEGATAIHGFTDEEVEDMPSFCDVAKEVCAFFTNCDLGGYNIRKFDIPVLMEEFHRCKMYPILLTNIKVVDAMSVYHKKEPRDLSAAVRFYCNEEIDRAHSAQADVEASIRVLESQLRHYSDLTPDVHSLHYYSCEDTLVDFSGKFSRNKEGRIIFNFGKLKGTVVDFDNQEVVSYTLWMKDSKSFPVDTLMAIGRARAHHTCYKGCQEWLRDKNLLASLHNTKALHDALTFEKNVYPFSVASEGKKISVTYDGNPEPALTLCSEDDKKTLLFLLQHSLTNKDSTSRQELPI